MQETANSLNVLSAMITPAVLISACGTLIFSTSTRLARIVDRVRELDHKIEQLCSNGNIDFAEERRLEVEKQLTTHARRSRYVQRALTSFYLSLGMFVGTTVAIGIVSLLRYSMWLPNILGIAGTVVLFYGCMMLIAETRLALQSINSEMAFTLMLSDRYRPQSAMVETRSADEARAASESRRYPFR